MPRNYYTPYGDFIAPYRVKVCAEYYDYHEILERSRRKCATFAAVREVAAAFHSKYHTGNGRNRVYCEVLDAKGYYVPPSVWNAQG